MWKFLFYVLAPVTAIYVLRELFKNGFIYLRFQYKFWLYYAWTMCWCTILLPFFLFRQNNPRNGVIVCMGMNLVTHIIGIKWHLRNVGVLSEDRGAVIVGNHQSSLDILGLSNIWKAASKCIIVSKKAMMYILPSGLCMYWCGSIFIDRKNPKDAYTQLETSAAKAFKNKIKIFMFPEGTRNSDLTKFLPFKKGAFALAISAQVPIIPVVFSPYYFISNEKQIFNKGNMIIQCLEPVPTEGLTMDDLPELTERVHEIMRRTYKELLIEVKASLPSNYPVILPDVKTDEILYKCNYICTYMQRYF